MSTELVENGRSPSLERKGAIDLIKTIAILGVLVIHSCDITAAGLGSLSWLSKLFWGSIARGSVPLFFMCSGVLFFDASKKEPKIFAKTLPRVLVALFFWAGLYQLYHLWHATPFAPSGYFGAFKNLVLFRHEFHLYYLHIILLFYIFVPVVRIFLKNAGKKEVLYLLTLWFLLAVLYPTLRPFWPFSLLSGIPTQWIMNMTYASIGYGVLGHYLSRYPIKKHYWGLGIAILGFCVTFLGTYFLSVGGGTLYTGFLEGMSIGVFLLAVGLFIFLSGCTLKNGRMTVFIAKASFCIYLSHMFALYVLRQLGFNADSFFPLLSIPILVLIAFFAGMCLYILLVRIPFINKWII